jgi:hypothetical protein
MKIHPWQQDLLTKLGGWKPGEMMLVSAGRQSGKSTLASHYWQMMKQQEISYSNAGKAEVDGELWYTVKCNKEAGAWIRSLPKEGNWFEHIDSQWYVYQHMFDLHERVYVQLGLKFT